MAGRPDAFMPLYIGDYLADTGHLSTAEHGAYLLLLMHYWRTGKPLPVEGDKLARIAKMPRAEWDAVSVTVTDFFTVTVMDAVTVLTHKRVESELEHAKGKYAIRKAASDRANAAKKAAMERIANRDGDRDGIRSGDRDGDPIGTQSQSQSQSSKEEASLREAASKPKRERKVQTSLPDDCPIEADRNAAAQFWRDRGRGDLSARLGDEAEAFRAHHAAHGSRMADWGAAWRTWYGNAVRFQAKPKQQQAGATVPRPAYIDTHADGWRERVRSFGVRGSWSSAWGPKPGEPGCKCPQNILDEGKTQ